MIDFESPLDNGLERGEREREERERERRERGSEKEREKELKIFIEKNVLVFVGGLGQKL